LVCFTVGWASRLDADARWRGGAGVRAECLCSGCRERGSRVVAPRDWGAQHLLDWRECVNWGEITSVATAIAVLIAALQLRAAATSARTAFEDALAREYREIARRIPIEAHLNEELEGDEFHATLPAFCQYLDLSNQQVFLRVNGRIRRATWDEWCEGIRFNLSRKAFHTAWEHLKGRDSKTFNELRRLEQERFELDPRSWMPWVKRLKSWWAH